MLPAINEKLRFSLLQLQFNCGLARNGPLVLTLPVTAIPLKLNVLLFGQVDNGLGERRLFRPGVGLMC